MSDTPAVNNAAPAQGQDQEQGGGGTNWLHQILQVFIMSYMMSQAMKYFTGTPPASPESSSIDGEIGNVLPHTPFWEHHTKYNIRIYLNEEKTFSLMNPNEEDLIFQQFNIDYSCDDTSNYFEDDIEIDFADSEKFLNTQSQNGTMYAHVLMYKLGYPYIESDADFEWNAMILVSHPLIEYKKLKEKKTENLLGFGAYTDTDADTDTDTDTDAENAGEEPGGPLKKSKKRRIVGHWKPELTMRPLCDWQTYGVNAIPAPMNTYYQIDYETHQYWPVLYMDDFWLLRSLYIPINESVYSVPLKIIHNPITQWKFLLQIQMAAQYKQQKKVKQFSFSSLFSDLKNGSGNGSADASGAEEDDADDDSDDEQDEVRRLLLESNPYLLGLTLFVTCLHTVFDCLAFKNDIQFWSKTESVEGLSVRTIFVNCFCQVIIFLYLLDQNTTWMILFSTGIGCVIEFWKVTRASDVTYGLTGNRYLCSWFGPWIAIADRDSYTLSMTQQYDKQALKYMSYAMYPMLFGYCVYSLLYNEHKGWYSFVIGTLVSFIYMFGFITLCPQLYLNYKLKSTAHLPWRMMTYKFLNTIIDDCFAFLIKMPLMHRISCFRDDIVFLIFLYQKWIYVTDYDRVNEYGYKAKATPTSISATADEDEDEDQSGSGSGDENGNGNTNTSGTDIGGTEAEVEEGAEAENEAETLPPTKETKKTK